MIYVKSAIIGTGLTMDDARRPQAEDVIRAQDASAAMSHSFNDAEGTAVTAAAINPASVSAVTADPRVTVLTADQAAAEIQKLDPDADISWLRCSRAS